jgi:hypothetical protein
MLQEILLNEPGEKKNIENLNEILNFFDKPCLNSPLNKRDFLLPLNENINTDMGSNISLKEMENIMKDSPKNEFDEDDSTDIYFTKSSKIDLQSTDCSTKSFSLTDKDEIYKDFFRTVLHKKRGRKKENEGKTKKSKKCHSSDDFDNIQRKIQVSFISFLVRLANDLLKNIFGQKTKFHFKDVDYELKKIVNHKYIEFLKKSNYSDIMKMKISPKNKRFSKFENKETLNKVCNYSPFLKKFFGNNYLYIFQKYYCTIINNKEEVDIDGFKVTLSPKTKTLYNLLIKNESNKKKFKSVVEDVYFSEINYNNNQKFVISPTLQKN